MNNIEKHFEIFRNNIIGNNQFIQTNYGMKKMIYADWAASGRLYKPIEEKLMNEFGPFVANPHTETNMTGKTITWAYQEAKNIIKEHVQASNDDILIFEGTGMTGAVRKVQRMLGLTAKEKRIKKLERPVVFITHMEHHSNHTSWEETIADVVVLPPDSSGEVSKHILEEMIQSYKNRPLKIGAFTACSNVTGIQTPYYQLAEVMHRYGGICFVDFSASAPYVPICMHPENQMESLDGIFFSPHKFLGGPGTSGVAVLSRKLFNNPIPDRPGGGTVKWTNPWGGRSYISNMEEREDGGTPGFLQAIKTALSIRLKEKMNCEYMSIKDEKLSTIMFDILEKNDRIILLEKNKKNRLPIFSFYVEGIHHQLLVKLLNDIYGIQARGGCSCAGTYGHYLLGIGKEKSKQITDEIDKGNLYVKPGWVRVSLHPTMTEEEVRFIANGICDIVDHIDKYKDHYSYFSETNDFRMKNEQNLFHEDWFYI